MKLHDLSVVVQGRGVLSVRSKRQAWALVVAVALAPVFLSAAGCMGRAGRVSPAKYDPPATAAEAIELNDRDGDGALSREEAAAAPGLAAAFKSIDTNADTRLDAAEIEARLAAYASSPIGVHSLTCFVTVAGKPLPGASVDFIPEPFLTKAIGAGKATTGSDGSGAVQPAEGKGFGVRAGFYRVQVSLERDGKESIPPKYNTQTQLGFEVSSTGGEPARFDLDLR